MLTQKILIYLAISLSVRSSRMKRIPAIVLTYDANHLYTSHMVRLYGRLWPDHPFEFLVPYQSQKARMGLMEVSPSVQARSAPPSIRQTVLSLLEGYQDDQWIYWCIDDKYPVWLDVSYLRSLSATILASPLRGVDGICFCRARKLLSGKALMADRFGLRKVQFSPSLGLLFRRSDYSQIWLHQFLRVGVLRHLFTSFPEVISGAKQLDELKRSVDLPGAHRIYVTYSNHARFGESTSRGRVTVNCLRSMESEGLLLPSSDVSACQEMFIGSDGARPIGCALRDIASVVFFLFRYPWARLQRFWSPR